MRVNLTDFIILTHSWSVSTSTELNETLTLYI